MDERPAPGRFLLTGSACVLGLHTGGHTLPFGDRMRAIRLSTLREAG